MNQLLRNGKGNKKITMRKPLRVEDLIIIQSRIFIRSKAINKIKGGTN